MKIERWLLLATMLVAATAAQAQDRVVYHVNDTSSQALDRFIQEAEFTPSGVVRITKLQIQSYAYIKP